MAGRPKLTFTNRFRVVWTEWVVSDVAVLCWIFRKKKKKTSPYFSRRTKFVLEACSKISRAETSVRMSRLECGVVSEFFLFFCFLNVSRRNRLRINIGNYAKEKPPGSELMIANRGGGGGWWIVLRLVFEVKRTCPMNFFVDFLSFFSPPVFHQFDRIACIRNYFL